MSYYQFDATRPGFFGHCGYGVKDIQAAEPFYTATLKPLGLEITFKDSKEVADAKMLGYGIKGVPGSIFVWLFHRPDSNTAHPATHISWNAPSRAAVDEFYAAALKHEGRDDGPPGPRTMYGPNYYCCFVFDKDGHRFEVVYNQAV